MAKDFVLTQEGYNKLKEQLDYLKNVRRKEASERIKQARELGDLSENAEYDSAKEEQGIIEADIKRIEDELERAVIIEDPKSSNKVTLGCTVRIREDGEEEEFHPLRLKPYSYESFMKISSEISIFSSVFTMKTAFAASSGG